MTSKNVLIVIPDASTLWHVWCLDHAVKTLKAGNCVSILDLSNLNPSYFRKPARRLLRKFFRRYRFDKISESISRENNITYLTSSSFGSVEGNLRDISERYSVRFWDAIDSKYATIIGRRIRNQADINPKLLGLEKYLFNLASDIVIKACSAQRYDHIVVANGLQGIAGSVVATADILGMPVEVLESVSDARFSYQAYPSDFRENPKFLQDDIQQHWDKGESSKYEVAEEALAEKLFGKRAGTISWSSLFAPSKESLVKQNSKVAVMFPTSDFERPISSHLDKNTTFQGSQLVAFATFSEIAKRYGYALIVRGHPHSDTIKMQMEDKIWSQFCEEKSIQYIPSSSKTNSQDLMLNSSLNVSYLSSCTLDSIILGRNSLALARQGFTNLIPEICAFTPLEIEIKLAEPNLKIDKSRIYPWAYHYRTAGEDVTLFDMMDDNGDIFYNGKKIDEVRFDWVTSSRFASKVRSWLTPRVE
jgi:hypothetical protein